MIYDKLVTLALRVNNSLSIDIYFTDPKLRYSIYECLIASVHSYNREVGPLTHIASQLIRNGMLDTCPQVS